YELTQALPISKVESIYYTRHKNSRRHFGALVAYVVGYDVLFIPLATSPLFIRSVGDGTADVQKVALAYGALVAVGLPVVYWGRHLLKTTVPKKYDLNAWTAEFPE
ncbi:MAG: hypothetical protein IT236_08940, partial [Bacteroidia bacterium]|nr:hypothetical protein [Bacteroidia bacterium]